MAISVPDKAAHVKNYVTSKLGEPIISTIDREEKGFERALGNALIKYWTAIPWTYDDVLDVDNFMNLDLTRSVSQLMDAAFGPDPEAPIRKSAYYIGIIRISEMSRAIQYSNLDAFLLNIPFGTPPRVGAGALGSDVVTGPLDVRKLILEQSEQDYLTGNVEVEFDRINDRIIFHIPIFFGQVTASHGFGFLDTTLRMLPWEHVHLFADIVAENLLTTIISARSSVQLQADFQLPVEWFTTLRSELRQENFNALSAASPVVILWS